MKKRLQGSPEDIIRKCDVCEYCIFEDILQPKQRKIKVLDLKIPKYHVHRATIEQICGRNYVEVCHLKYAAMRALCDDRTAMQMGVVKNYVWDLGKQHKKSIKFDHAISNWTKAQDLGRGVRESYAQRYKTIWNKGIRTIRNNGSLEKKQILTADHIYEMVMAKPQTYETILVLLDSLITEHKERDDI